MAEQTSGNPFPQQLVLPFRPRRGRSQISQQSRLALLTWANNFKEVTDHHSALRFLDASYDENAPWGDDYVIALAGAKKAETDDHSHQEKVEKAVRLVAEHRNSAVLHA
jgi:hypothetical protein